MNWSKFLLSDKHPLLNGLWTGLLIAIVGFVFTQGLITIIDRLLHAAKAFCHG